jgi:microcystin degradation protein MlrC
MTDAQLAAWEASRDSEAELLESVRQMRRGDGVVAYSPVIAARQNSKLSQAHLAGLGARAQVAIGGSAQLDHLSPMQSQGIA